MTKPFHKMADEKDPPQQQVESNHRRRIREPPSVPFLWEEQPGIPKKEWKLGSPSVTTIIISSPGPFKAFDYYVPSFVWEEEDMPPPPQYSINLMDSPLPLPPALTGGHGGETYYEREISSSSSDDDCHDPDDNEHKEGGAISKNTCFKSDMESFVFETNRVPSRHVKLVASVPFMWEEKPGTPLPSFSSWHMWSETDDAPPPEANLRHENNHQASEPPRSSVTRIMSRRPIKLVASVPFSWEEMPGKPLPSFSWQTDQTQLEVFSSISHGNNINTHRYYDDDMLEFDVESFSFDTDESFSSAANCLVPSAAAISTTTVPDPVQTNPFLSMDQDDTDDTESSTSSNDTEASSFVGSSLLDWLFPNFPPTPGLLEKRNNGASEKVPPPDSEMGTRDLFGCSSNGGGSFAAFRTSRPKTLGELIMMSRRKSYVRKAAHITKQNKPSMHDFVKRSTFGGCNFGNTGKKLIQGLNLKRRLLRLKLV